MIHYHVLPRVDAEVMVVNRRSNIGSVWMVAGVSMVMFAMLIGASTWSAIQREEAARQNAPVTVPEAKTDTERKADRMTLGSPTAQAHLVEYGDFL